MPEKLLRPVMAKNFLKVVAILDALSDKGEKCESCTRLKQCLKIFERFADESSPTNEQTEQCLKAIKALCR